MAFGYTTTDVASFPAYFRMILLPPMSKLEYGCKGNDVRVEELIVHITYQDVHQETRSHRTPRLLRRCARTSELNSDEMAYFEIDLLTMDNNPTTLSRVVQRNLFARK